MNRIKVLDINVANKIAAGEVVERPASVIKELVENSIDAQATIITIEIADGGMSYMRVSDNGIGMSKEDAKNCFLRHATSKIQDVDDLFSIKTLGFRGEAMASIAAVARLTLKTHRKDDGFGTSVLIDGGTIRDVSPCGCPNGTVVEVSDLFYNVPARLKFMKSKRAEASYISDYVSRMILSRPDISFKFINNGSIVYHSSGDGNLKNAVYSIYGAEVIPHLRAVEYEDEYVKISGYVGSEQISRPNRTQQSFFVNNRYIKSLKLSSAVLAAYDTRIMSGRFPFVVLSLNMDYGNVDVNVHPNKLEVKFSDEQRISSALTRVVSKALGSASVSVYEFKNRSDKVEEENAHDIVPKDRQNELFMNLMSSANFDDPVSYQNDKSVTVPDTISHAEENSPDVSIPFYPVKDEFVSTETEKITKDTVESLLVNIDKKNVQVEFEVSPYEVLGSVFDAFWLIRQNENLFIMDQHAAHERILYEEAIKGELKAHTQLLLVPITVKLSGREYNTYTENKELFSEFGFIIEEFGMLTLRITAVPHILDKAEDESFFKDALFLLEKQKNITLTDMKREALIRASCKSAVKLGNVVPAKMIEAILDEYNKNGIPMTCPHGRPVMIAITKNDLFKKFKRIL